MFQLEHSGDHRGGNPNFPIFYFTARGGTQGHDRGRGQDWGWRWWPLELR